MDTFYGGDGVKPLTSQFKIKPSQNSRIHMEMKKIFFDTKNHRDFLEKVHERFPQVDAETVREFFNSITIEGDSKRAPRSTAHPYMPSKNFWTSKNCQKRDTPRPAPPALQPKIIARQFDPELNRTPRPYILGKNLSYTPSLRNTSVPGPSRSVEPIEEPKDEVEVESRNYRMEERYLKEFFAISKGLVEFLKLACEKFPDMSEDMLKRFHTSMKKKQDGLTNPNRPPPDRPPRPSIPSSTPPKSSKPDTTKHLKTGISRSLGSSTTCNNSSIRPINDRIPKHMKSREFLESKGYKLEGEELFEEEEKETKGNQAHHELTDQKPEEPEMVIKTEIDDEQLYLEDSKDQTSHIDSSTSQCDLVEPKKEEF